MPLLAALLVLAPVPAQTQTPDLEAAWVGYDTSAPDEARWPRALAPGDLDGDGDVDYAVASGSGLPGLSVLRNLGSATFGQPEVTDPLPGEQPEDLLDLALADLDRDGDLDVAMARTGLVWTGEGVVVHDNLGDGTFGPLVVWPGGKGATGIVAADLSGDGWPDLATADYGSTLGGGTTVTLLRNDGAGGFLPPAAVAVPEDPFRLAAGDLDADGRLDLVVAHHGQLVSVLRSTGAGFAVSSHDVLPAPVAGDADPDVALADLDRDGHLDVLYTSTKTGSGDLAGTGSVALLHGDGSGGLLPPLELQTAPESQGGVGLAVADWNGDGWPDVASAHQFDGEWMLFESDGRGGFLPFRRFAAGAYTLAVDGSDVSGDGRPDVVLLARHALELCVYENDGQAGFEGEPLHDFVDGSAVVGDGLDTADVDGDGDLDLGTAWTSASGNGGTSVLRNHGDATFADADVYPGGGGGDFRFRDVSGDGVPDQLWSSGSAALVRRGLGDGTFGAAEVWGFPCLLGDVDAADVDGDADLDLLASTHLACDDGHPLYVRPNLGGGVFGPALEHELSHFCDAIAHGDLDEDGDLDLVTNSGFQGVETSLGNGDGTFQEPFQTFTAVGPKGVRVVDLDGDGHLDLATSDLGGGSTESSWFTVARGFGDGGFGLPTQWPAGYDAEGGLAGPFEAFDADGDGDLELLVGNRTSLDVSLVRNRGDLTFEPQVRYGVGEPVYATAAGDLDGDGRVDVAVGVHPGLALTFRPAVRVLRGTGGTPWDDAGFGLAGAHGIPVLDASAPLVQGGEVTLSLSEAASGAPGAYVVGAELALLPALGGVVAPSLDLLLPLQTDAAGAHATTQPWPAGVAFGAQVHVQAWVLDAAGPAGFAASAALTATQY